MKFILIAIFGYRLLIDVIKRKRLILKCSSRVPEVMVHAAEKSDVCGGNANYSANIFCFFLSVVSENI